ncbi:2-hydroxyacid dehydrogenase [Dactylosporangium salmoneum]|uniref:NAD(P)-dependent oxidoreductase n=1 Tax=Dactylosporangium salmoneum TaxID=53361 RepID=A0ABP5UYY1_9ACTN
MKFVCVDGVPRYRDLAATFAATILRPYGHDLVWYEEAAPDADRFAELAAGADGLLLYGLRGRFPAEVLDRCPTIKIVGYLGTGVARAVDVPAVRSRGVAVCNVPDYASDSVAELTVALLLAVARRLTEGDRTVRAGEWARRPGRQLIGKQLGVVGAGPIAAKVISRARGLGMRPVCWTRRPTPERAAALGVEFVELPALFAESDVVSLHLSHTPATDGLISAQLLGTLKPDAIFVNTARAELVDTAALYDLLRREAIFGAGLDVFDSEPPDLSALPLDANLVLAPHAASVTAETFGVALRIGIENMRAFAAGQLVNEVTE